MKNKKGPEKNLCNSMNYEKPQYTPRNPRESPGNPRESPEKHWETPRNFWEHRETTKKDSGKLRETPKTPRNFGTLFF